MSDTQLDDHSQCGLANEAWKRGAAYAAQKILDHLEPIDTIKVAVAGNSAEASLVGTARIVADKFIKRVK